MAWTYHNWREQTALAARLSALRSHLTEVSAAMTARISEDGTSYDPGTLNDYLRRLEKEEKSLARASGRATVTRGRGRGW